MHPARNSAAFILNRLCERVMPGVSLLATVSGKAKNFTRSAVEHIIEDEY
jgi:hypothetical protein